jgi:hypothetical protein
MSLDSEAQEEEGRQRISGILAIWLVLFSPFFISAFSPFCLYISLISASAVDFSMFAWIYHFMSLAYEANLCCLVFF